jgi:cation diffusion facilitator CzcD-associated flavoprotein CzcO
VNRVEHHPDERILDLLVVGAGFAGLCAAIKAREQGIDDLLVLEKRPGVGGTWWDNRYPGAACDIPSHLYSFSFFPNPDWTRVYSPQAEIQAYLQSCVEHFDLAPLIRHGCRVVGQRFDGTTGLWETQCEDGRRFRSRHVINASGGLHLPKYPDIPGRDAFAGHAMHAARWDPDFDPAGRRIAIIGSAASAIQILPELARTARRVTLFQRTPNYVMPRHDRAYSAAERRRFRRWPLWRRLYRLSLFMRLEWFVYPLMRERSWLRRLATRRFESLLRRRVPDPALRQALRPDYEMGCKRILISDDFYESLGRDNVTLETAGIAAIEPGGVRTRDGRLVEADGLIFATGYDLEANLRQFDVVGPGGRRLSRQWADLPEAYYGCCVPGFPNLYFATGPNTGVGSTSVVFIIEQEIAFILGCIRRAGRDRLLGVREAACRRYNADIQAALQRSVWASGCHSWYRREDGRIATLYPWNARRFRRQLARWVALDFELETRPAAVPPARTAGV